MTAYRRRNHGHDTVTGGHLAATRSATRNAAASMSGLAYWRAVADGQLPPPPIAELVRMNAVEAEHGRVTFTCTPDASMYNPLGMVHGGVVCTVLDTATACALHTTLPRGRQLHQRRNQNQLPQSRDRRQRDR